MLSAIRIGVCVVAIAGSAAVAETSHPSFAQLLERAHAQAASGHKWAPPGDNLVETFTALIDILPTATPEQLSEFQAMLEQSRLDSEADRKRMDTERNQAPGGAPAKADAVKAATGDPPDAPANRPATQLASRAMPSAPDQPVVSAENVPISQRQQAASRPPVDGRSDPASKPGAATPQPAPPSPQMAAYANALLEKGRAAEAQGDVSGARRYYTIAAEQGVAAAAQALGRLYDPAVLRGKVLGGIDPDPQAARRWYDLAAKLNRLQTASSDVSGK